MGGADIRRVCVCVYVCVCKNVNVRIKSGIALRSLLASVKDKLPSIIDSSVVYRIPCSSVKVYVGGTRSRLETRIRDHKDA